MTSITTPTRPRLLICSSREGLAVAGAVREHLAHVCEVAMWTDGVLALGQSTFESLVAAPNRYDFAVFVLTPDDLLRSRGEESKIPRSNVLLEMGIFIGALGRARTFSVHDCTAALPSDLEGIAFATYEPSTSDLLAAVEPACRRIRDVIDHLACRNYHEGLAILNLLASIPDVPANMVSLEVSDPSKGELWLAILRATRSILATCAIAPRDWWLGPSGRRALEIQAARIAAGELEVRRVFILNDETHSQYMPHLREQGGHGAKVTWVDESDASVRKILRQVRLRGSIDLSVFTLLDGRKFLYVVELARDRTMRKVVFRCYDPVAESHIRHLFSIGTEVQHDVT